MQILEKHLRVTFRGRSFSRWSSAFYGEDNDFSQISKERLIARKILEILPEKHLNPLFFSHISRNCLQVRKILEILPSKRGTRVFFSNISTNYCPARNILEIYAKSTCSRAFFS